MDQAFEMVENFSNGIHNDYIAGHRNIFSPPMFKDQMDTETIEKFIQECYDGKPCMRIFIPFLKLLLEQTKLKQQYCCRCIELEEEKEEEEEEENELVECKVCHLNFELCMGSSSDTCMNCDNEDED